MDDSAFDTALIDSAFGLAAERGWARVSVTEAARAASLPLDRARGRFPGRAAILARFGRMADQSALAHATTDGSHRDRLFDLVMRRVDVLQAHRPGVLALRDYLPRQPALALMLALATAGSMAWMLEGAGISAQGWRGRLRVRGMVAVWLWTLRAWERDDSEDLSGTMRALDAALDRAERAESWLHLHGRAPAAQPGDAAGEAPPAEAEPIPMVEGVPQGPVPGTGYEPPLPPPPAAPEPPASPAT